MKKALSVVLVLILSCTLFASSTTADFVKEDLLDTEFNVIFPDVSATLFHASRLMGNEVGAKAISDLTRGTITSDLSNIAMVVVRNLSAGDDSLLGAHAGFGGSYKNYGFAFDLDVCADTYAKDVVGIDTLNIIPVVRSSFSFAYARHIFDNEIISVDANTVAHINSVVVNDGISYKSILDKSADLIKGGAGLGLPVDLEAKAVFCNGINCYVELDNLFGIYFLKSYNGKNQIASSMFSFGKDGKYSEPWHLNTGASYSYQYKVLTATAFSRINNINTLFNKNFVSNLKRNIDLGVNIDIYDILNVEVGIYGGFFGTNLSVGYNNNRINISYGWSETGSLYGEAPVDHLGVGVTLGWKK